MFKDILNKNQLELLNLIKEFSREFYLVGGTAIALHLGHRRSIDFDLFKTKAFNKKKVIDKIEKFYKQYKIIYKENDQLHLLVNNVKITFFEYGFDIPHKNKFENIINLPSLIDLSAMKAYALGRRAKWKDYVDLYFIFNQGITVNNISERAIEIFGSLFSKKMFVQQLCYFNDIDYTEEVDYLIDPVSENKIKEYLTQIAVQKF